MNKIDGYFNSYPDAQQLYETSDGQVFLEKAKAETHAQRLAKKGVTTYIRGHEETLSDEAVAALKAEEKAKAKEKLMALDFTAEAKTFEQPELLQIAKALEVATPDNKKATLIAALSELQAEYNGAGN
jgi:DNA topoisomerase IA